MIQTANAEGCNAVVGSPEVSAARPTASVALSNFDALPDSAWVRKEVVAQVLGVSIPTVWRWSKGLLPPPKKIGPNVTAWNVQQLRQFMAERLAA